MASSRPVRIWVARQIPSRNPKFHHIEMLDGVGGSIKELLMVFIRGCDFRMLGAISFF